MMAAKKRRRKKRGGNPRTRGIILGILILVAILVGVLIYFGSDQGEASLEESGSGTPVEDRTLSGPVNPLTGEAGFDAEKLGVRPVAIMINNAPAARPQWGLCSPDIVFEGLVEGGATRMMWVYADVDDIPKVGSVRSARHDFVELAEGLDAQFVHWGGSDLAYDAMSARGVDDIDGISYEGRYFFRDQSRDVAIEHRGYTTGEDIVKAIRELGRRTELDPGYAEPFAFGAPGEMRALSGGSCQSVSFDFSSVSSYSHTFNYDAQEKLYYNRIGGAPMCQDDGEQMAVTNVLLLYCTVRNTGDSAGHMEMSLTSGSGVYISNGTYESIRWEKGDPGDPLKLESEDGTELILNSGKSYIGFVPTSEEESVTIS